ncbi:hypothetical protein L1887_00861 [Cichorium endivia]|nr:hypothetical protein L1887_00861 [Cichorium endivia]
MCFIVFEIIYTPDTHSPHPTTYPLCFIFPKAPKPSCDPKVYEAFNINNKPSLTHPTYNLYVGYSKASRLLTVLVRVA